MSRWFRHYAGMMRDPKLVRVSKTSGQRIDRVAWVFQAILESAADIDAADGQYDISDDEIAYFLRCEPQDIAAIRAGLFEEGLIAESCVVGFHRKFGPRSARLPWSEWAGIRLYVFERDSYTCRYCGASGVRLECDHIVPISKGGSNEKSNLVAACKTCNTKKGDKSLEELGWSL